MGYAPLIMLTSSMFWSDVNSRVQECRKNWTPPPLAEGQGADRCWPRPPLITTTTMMMTMTMDAVGCCTVCTSAMDDSSAGDGAGMQSFTYILWFRWWGMSRVTFSMMVFFVVVAVSILLRLWWVVVWLSGASDGDGIGVSSWTLTLISVEVKLNVSCGGVMRIIWFNFVQYWFVLKLFWTKNFSHGRRFFRFF